MTFKQFSAIQYTIIAYAYEPSTTFGTCCSFLFLILYGVFTWLAIDEFINEDNDTSEEKQK